MGLRAAACKVDITPADGTNPVLHGWGTHTANGKDLDKPNGLLFARVLLLQYDNVKALIIGLDAAWATLKEGRVPMNLAGTECRSVPATLPVSARDRWANAAGIQDRDPIKKADLITVNATHTHNAPSLTEAMVETIAKEIEKLPAALQEVSVRAGTSDCPLTVYRALGRDVSVQHLPIDRTLTVMELRKADDTPVARLVNFGVHPILRNDDQKISPDFVGYAMEKLDGDLKGISIYLQGFSGDLGPGVDGRYVGKTMQQAEDVRNYGEQRFAEEVSTVLERNMAPVAVNSLKVAFNRVNLAIRTCEACFLQIEPIRIHGIALGEHALMLSVSAEVFSDYGPMLRKYYFPHQRYVLTSGVANGYSGYLPSAAAFKRRAPWEYEVHVSPFTPAAEQQLLDALGALFT